MIRELLNNKEKFVVGLVCLVLLVQCSRFKVQGIHSVSDGLSNGVCPVKYTSVFQGARVVRDFNELPEEFGVFSQIETEIGKMLTRPVKEVSETELTMSGHRFIQALREAVQKQNILLTNSIKLNSLGQLTKGTRIWCDLSRGHQYKIVNPLFTRNVFDEPSILQIVFTEDESTMVPPLIFLEFMQDKRVELFGGYTGYDSIKELGLRVSTNGLESFPKDEYRIIIYKRTLDNKGFFRLFRRGKIMIKFDEEYQNAQAGATIVFDEERLFIEVTLLRDKDGVPILKDGKLVTESASYSYDELR